MNWIEEKNPRRTGNPYDHETPHVFFDADSPLVHGVHHHHHGMAVSGMPPDRKYMAPGERVVIPPADCVSIRAAMKAQRVSLRSLARHIHRAAASIVTALDGLPALLAEDVEGMKALLKITS